MYQMHWKQVVNNLQIDISSHCNARCGACVRNVDGDATKKEVLLEHFDLDVWHRLITQDTRGWYIVELTLNGNWGDPMMHPQLVEMLDIYSKHHPESALYIHTNGSMRTTKFWSELAKACRKFSNHKVVFAVDGLADTHSIYRRKTDWNKIIENSRAFCEAGGRGSYTMTLFQHNQHQIDDVKKLAAEAGCVDFTLRHSHGDNLKIITVDGSYEIHASYDMDEFQEIFTSADDLPTSDLRDRGVYMDLNDQIRSQEFDSKCPWYNEGKIQIDPWGKVWPCCHVSLYGIHIDAHDIGLMVDNSFLAARETNDLKKYSLSEVLSNEWFNNVEEAVDRAKWKQCRDICGVCK
jgi:MoaA/NifB/PqqE/SkfB family radical SAM enzyme